MAYKFLISAFLFLFFAPAFGIAAIPVEQMPQRQIVKSTKKHHPFYDQKDDEGKPAKNPNRNGLLSMIFGIGSVLIFPLLAIPALVLGITSLTKKEPDQTMAIVGTVLGGLVTLALFAALIIFFVVLI